MVKITWSQVAVKDIDEIELYISHDSVIYAIATVEKIFFSVETLIRFPQSGRIVPEFANKNIRELLVGNYRIIYLILNNKEIIITRITHTSRLLK